MSIFIPIHDAYTLEVTVEVTFVDSDSLSASPIVSLHALFTVLDNDVLIVTTTTGSPANFLDTDSMIAVGRLNSDPNMFGQATFVDTDALIVNASTGILGYVTFIDQDSMIIDAGVVPVSSFGFTIFVDITDAAIQTALTSNIRRYQGRLKVDGVEIPIIRATLNAPNDKLGTELTVVLADPNVSLVTGDALIDFDLALWVSGAWQWINLLAGGRLSQRAARYVNEAGLPKDAVELTIVDIIGDRWNRAPRQQVFMYDSQIIEPPTQEAIISERIYNTTGGIYEPIFIGLAGMTLLDVLNYAYITGCGFSNIITNIENFPVEQVSFTVTGGYDAGVRNLLEMFSPVVFASSNDLWIIDPDQPLPSGISAVDFVAAFSASIDDTLPAHEPVNGLLVRLNDAQAGAEYFTERLETSTISNGLFGSAGYTEVDTERRIREFRSFGNPTTIIREEVVYVKTRTLDGDFHLISEETRTDHFDNLNRPVGYSSVVKMRLPDINDPDLGFILQTVTSEEQLIVYTPDPLHHLQDVQSRIETHVDGLILVDTNTQYLGADYKMPFLDAHRSGYITGDGQSTEFGPIRTVIDQLRFNGGQVQYETRVTNHISNVPDRINVKTLPGSALVNRRNSGQAKYILLTVPGTDATSRRVAEFDGSQLPYATALAIAQRRLTNLNNPPKEVAVNMAYVNPSLRRGAVIHVQGRSGYLGNYILKGYTISVEAGELQSYRASMSFSARELR